MIGFDSFAVDFGTVESFAAAEQFAYCGGCQSKVSELRDARFHVAFGGLCRYLTNRSTRLSRHFLCIRVTRDAATLPSPDYETRRYIA